MNADGEQTRVMNEWLRYSEGDLFSARALAKSSDLPARNACYLAQQCAEKALKAALIAAEVEVMRTHDLDALVQRLPKQLQNGFVIFDLSWLSEWCVEARYPGDWPEANTTDATQAITIAENVFALVKSLIDRRPFS